MVLRSSEYVVIPVVIVHGFKIQALLTKDILPIGNNNYFKRVWNEGKDTNGSFVLSTWSSPEL